MYLSDYVYRLEKVTRKQKFILDSDEMDIQSVYSISFVWL